MTRRRCIWCAREVYRKIGRFQLCAFHAADVLFADMIRERGECWAASSACFGMLQCAHILPRGRSRATRWDPENAVALCASHHLTFTAHPAEWERYCRERGVPWDALVERARLAPVMDPVDVVLALTEAA